MIYQDARRTGEVAGAFGRAQRHRVGTRVSPNEPRTFTQCSQVDLELIESSCAISVETEIVLPVYLYVMEGNAFAMFCR